MVDYILNNGNSKRYNFKVVSLLKQRKAQPAQSFPLIGASGTGNSLFKFTGQTQELTLSFAIYDDGVDSAGGTHTSTVTTIVEQVNYLMDNIYTPTFDTDFTLSTRFGSFDGLVTNIDVDNQSGGAAVITGTINFLVGNLVTL